MCVFLVFFGLTGVKEGKRSIETVALAGSDKVVDIEIVCILAAGAGVEVKLAELDVAAQGKRVLHTLDCPVDRCCLRKDVL